MSFQQIIGQDSVVRFLRQGLRNDRIAHAYCFAGPRGSGKHATAMQLAKALLCRNVEDDACDACSDCRRIDHGNHPDVFQVSPDGQSIKIEQVRQLQHHFSYSSAESTIRVVILREADTMTVQAANSLLKFLEEPSSRMVAVLLTENVNALLPTIRSRCQLLRFSPPDPALISHKLEQSGVDSGLARVAAHMSTGLEEAERLAAMDAFALLCERVIKWSEGIVSGKSTALLSIQTDFMQSEPAKDRLELVLDLLLLWLRDLLNEQLGRESQLVFSRWEEARRRQASLWSSSRLIRGMESVFHARRQLAGPVQPQAVLEHLVLAMQGGATHVYSGRSSIQTSG